MAMTRPWNWTGRSKPTRPSEWNRDSEQRFGNLSEDIDEDKQYEYTKQHRDQFSYWCLGVNTLEIGL